MPRLFTALEVPPDIARQLSLLRGGLQGARWIDAENYHITLRFIGDVDKALARDIDEELLGVMRQPLAITIDELSTFGNERPRAIIARIKPSRALLELQAEHERLVRRAGVAPEARKFVPHITLARLRSVSPVAVAGFLASRGLFVSQEFVASRVVLFSSRDSVGGGPYVTEAAYPLVEDGL